jgi:hypothetical protein
VGKVLEDRLQILDTVHRRGWVVDSWRHGAQGDIGQLTDTKGRVLNHIPLV